MMFENRVPREIFWPKRKEMTVERRKLNDKYLMHIGPCIIVIVEE